MSAAHASKSAFLYREIRRALQAGHYVPGQRIDPATIAAEFRTSLTPARYALYRLVGEDLIADHGRDGLHVPLPTEFSLHQLYDWMHRLLLAAFEIGFPQWTHEDVREVDLSPDDDLVKRTWHLFDAIASATGHVPLHRTVRRTNDCLAPIRRHKQTLLPDAFEELSELILHWRRRDIDALRLALKRYHDRRMQLVPCIVVLLNRKARDLH
ncbi:GntR family transcriptional regulator [Luteimonas saliphila]|uniref:GntR family transcriptional regulator n=1 Tax=Luteimonas saliphila TaxID=2804919 RepID=UPI00192DF023|nr:GntR family transcriptional regulator [Luteimonas saliphila]